MAELEAEPQPCCPAFPRAREIRALTGLRGAAALMVLGVHATPVLAPDAPGWLAAVLAHGQVAVDLFFVLSGFVLARAHADLGRAGVAAFLWRRAWRIGPLHAAVLCALALYVLAALSGGDGFIAPDFPWSRLLPTLLLVQPFLFGGATDWNPPDWSVAVEMLCSLGLWPALAALRALGRPRLVAGVLAVAAAANLAMHGGETAGWPAALRGACGFGFGMALWHVARLPDEAARGRPGGAGPVRSSLVAWVRRRARGTPAELLAAGGFLAAVATDRPWVSVVLAGWLILLLSREAGVVSRRLRGRGMAWLGRVSFSVYLVHVPLLIPFEGGWAWAGGWAGRLAVCGAYLALVAGVAALAERWVERPGRALAGPVTRRARPVLHFGHSGTDKTAVPSRWRSRAQRLRLSCTAESL